MHHLLANYRGKNYYICAGTNGAHYIKTIKSIYEDQFRSAQFRIMSGPMGRIEHSQYKSCLEFIKDYIANEHLAETIGD